MISNKQLTASTNLPIKFERDYKLGAAFFYVGVGERQPHAKVEK